MNSTRQKYFTALLVVRWLASIAVMVYDYLQYPPLPLSDPLSNRKGNTTGNIYRYGILSLIDLCSNKKCNTFKTN
jgi:hypothetical protein